VSQAGHWWPARHHIVGIHISLRLQLLDCVMGAAENLEELLSLDRVRQMTGMGTTFIYGEIKAGRFPRSIRIGRRTLWIQSVVQGWVRQQIVLNRPAQVDG